MTLCWFWNRNSSSVLCSVLGLPGSGILGSQSPECQPSSWFPKFFHGEAHSQPVSQGRRERGTLSRTIPGELQPLGEWWVGGDDMSQEKSKGNARRTSGGKILRALEAEGELEDSRLRRHQKQKQITNNNHHHAIESLGTGESLQLVLSSSILTPCQSILSTVDRVFCFVLF